MTSRGIHAGIPWVTGGMTGPASARETIRWWQDSTRKTGNFSYHAAAASKFNSGHTPFFAFIQATSVSQNKRMNIETVKVEKEDKEWKTRVKSLYKNCDFIEKTNKVI